MTFKRIYYEEMYKYRQPWYRSEDVDGISLFTMGVPSKNLAAEQDDWLTMVTSDMKSFIRSVSDGSKTGSFRSSSV